MNFLKVIFTFLLCTHIAFGQQASYFKLGEKEFEGVQIYDVIQDNNFNYWFATDQGFYKYDSYTFQKIDCSEMKGLSAFGFVMNQNGTIFCHNLNNQILKIENDTCSVFYELKEDEFSNDIYLAISPENYLIVISHSALILNKSGEKMNSKKPPANYYGFPFLTKKGRTICDVTGKGSLLILEGEKFSFAPKSNSIKQSEGVLKFFRIDKHTYAINTKNKKMYAFDEETYQLSLLSEKQEIQTSEYLRFYNENNQLWIAGTVSGVRILEGSGCQKLSEIMYSQFLISDVFKDHEGNILLSTFNNGVLVIPNLEIPDVLTLPEKQTIVSIHYDNDLGLIMGSLKGELLSYQNNQYKTLSNSGTRPLEAIYSWPNFPYIIFDDGKMKAYNKKNGQVFQLIEASLKGAGLIDDNKIYLALNVGGCVAVLDNFNSLKSEYIDSLKLRSYSVAIEPATKNVYVATSEGLKMLKTDGSVKNLLFNGKPIFANDLFSDNNILCASTKKDGILFFEDGNVTQNSIPKINQKEIEIYKLIVHNNKIYANSSSGFVIMALNGNVLIQLNMEHGFQTNKIFDFEIVDGYLWISHSKGVQKIHIGRLKNNIAAPIIKIATIEVNDIRLKNFSENKFKSNQRKFRFIISSPSLRNKENISYYYTLDGYENKWMKTDYNDNEITYNALAPGDYTFIVKTENQGVYSSSVTYSFTILPPFYFSWWFITLCGFVFFGTILFVYRWRLNIQRKKSQQINELNASKLTAIQSQMNPHFIFNALNSIQDLVLKGDVDNSYTFITKFSNLVRRTLNYSDKDFIDFDQEIKLLELYLTLEKLRFKNDFNYTIESENVMDIMLPPLLVQPFIENALVHGLLHKEGEKKLKISFELKDALICTIEDNGVGREKAKAIKQRQRSEHESFSGNAIHKRFEILSNIFDGKFGYTYEDLYEKDEPVGTKVILRIPVKHKF